MKWMRTPSKSALYSSLYYLSTSLNSNISLLMYFAAAINIIFMRTHGSTESTLGGKDQLHHLALPLVEA